MTPDKLKQGSEWMGRKDPDCTYDIKTRTRNSFAGTMQCGAKGTAEIEVRAKDREHVAGTMNGRFSEGGRAQTMRIEFSSSWLGPDCGSVK